MDRATPFSNAELEEKLHFFWPETRLASALPCAGNINRTWIVSGLMQGKEFPQSAVLQRVNSAVFPNPSVVMANFRAVTKRLAAIRSQCPEFPVFPLAYANKEGQDFFLDEKGFLWRLLSYIGPARSITRAGAAEAAAMGGLLARFHTALAGISPEKLADPLPGFHDTHAYLKHFQHISKGKTPANKDEAFCFEHIAKLSPLALLLRLDFGVHSRQLVHGDPKCANFLFAKTGARALSLIDLDTVRPDFLLHDLGDALRSCCNPMGEDSAAPRFASPIFHVFLREYLKNGGRKLLPPGDLRLLFDATGLMVFELGLRFFTDHLEGNRYFFCRYPEHNLRRAITQFMLYDDLSRQEKLLRKQTALLVA